MGKRNLRYRGDVIQIMSLTDGEWPINPDDTTYTWRLLSEGDSWFTNGAIPSSDLLFEFRFNTTTVILNLGYTGDTINYISEFWANSDLVKRLTSPNWASKWNAILLSGGGYDLIDRVSDILRNKPTGTKKPDDYLNHGALNSLKKELHKGVRRSVELRGQSRSPNAGKPIIVHTYDYPTQRNSSTTFLIEPITRPWLYPVLALQQQLPNFHVVDTRNTLECADYNSLGSSGDWLTEISPNIDDYRKIDVNSKSGSPNIDEMSH